MFKELLDAWRGKDVLSQMYDGLVQMIEDDEWMFRNVCSVLFGERPASELAEELYERDIRVNKTERRIRKQIVEHLAVRPGTDVTSCLVLMSVSKDAERIGDYCKNLFEVERLARGGLTGDGYVKAFRELAEDIGTTFGKTRRAFADGDSDLGHEIIEHELEIGGRCDELLKRLADDALECRRAVAYTVTVRHLKRVSAHLGNIASSVVMPIHKIDYFDEKWDR
jgi:phosphate transport system protein